MICSMLKDFLQLCSIACAVPLLLWGEWPPSPVVDTGQTLCYDIGEPIRTPREGAAYFGQDAQYQGVQPSYRDNGDGTVTDLVTGLMWSQATDPNKLSLEEAKQVAKDMTLAGYDDWRAPNVKELYSLIDFRGVTGLMMRGGMSEVPATSIPYINTDYFEFRYGDVAQG